MVNEQMNKQKLAIVLPTLNNDCLYQCLDSLWDTNKGLWKGDYQDLTGELIIVQDIPSEERLNYLKRLSQIPYGIYNSQGGGYTVLVNQSKIGPQKAWNIGTKWALEHGADYIMLTNDDCIFPSDDMFYKLVSVLKENPEYGYISPVIVRDQGYIPNYFAAIAECSIHTRQCIERVGLFNESTVFSKIGADVEYNYRLLNVGYKPHGVSDTIAKHLSPGQTIRSTNPITHNDIIELDKTLMQHYGKDSRAVDEHRIPAHISSQPPITDETFTDIKSVDQSVDQIKVDQIKKESNNMTKLNIGSFTVMHSNNWINLDILDLTDYAKQNNFIFKQADCSTNIPYQDNLVDILIASHYIEHIDRPKGKQFLKESLRVLKHNGIIRLTVPDAEIITKDYLSGNISRHSSHNVGVKNAEDDAQSLYELLIAGHQTIYDFQSLSKLLEKTGFTDIEKMEYQKSKSKIIQDESIDMFPELSLYIEAVKPNVEKYIERSIGNNITKGGLPEHTEYKPVPSPPISILKEHKSLRIALISTPFFGCPPSGYGGLEAVVWDLAEELDKLGHTVTLFAPEGSKKPDHGNLVTTGSALDTVGIDWYQAEKNNYEIYKDLITSDRFDIVDGHDWFAHEYLLKLKDPKLRVTHQHHGGLQWDTPAPVPKMNLVALSKFMQNYTISYFKQKGFNVDCRYNYNGVNLDFYKYYPSIKRTNRLLYVGRFSTFKGAHHAIELAKKVNLPIDLIGAAKFIDDSNYLKEIESMCDNDKIVMYKDTTNEFKLRKMQEARALIFPSRMNEPFGLGIVQAMATGSPVIAFDDGAVKEIITNDTGFVCNNVDDMVNTINKIDTIKSEDCRKRAEFFSKENMAKNKEKLYYHIINGNEW